MFNWTTEKLIATFVITVMIVFAFIIVNNIFDAGTNEVNTIVSNNTHSVSDILNDASTVNY